MSIWTHVLGTIRFDSWTGLEPAPNIGISCHFTDPPEQWDKCNIPCGSEGSLFISKWEDPSKSTVAKYTITIFGDLRDYDDEQGIIDYFNRITKDQDIRQACFTFYVEGKDARTFVWKENIWEKNGKEKFVEVMPDYSTEWGNCL